MKGMAVSPVKINGFFLSKKNKIKGTYKNYKKIKVFTTDYFVRNISVFYFGEKTK
jgi:hypothetical protein